MKKLIGLIFIAAMLTAGCATAPEELEPSMYEPLIGSWSSTDKDRPVTLEFRADKTCVKTRMFLGVKVTNKGKWLAGATTLTQRWPGQFDLIQNYSIDASRNRLILSPSTDGLTTTYVSMN